MQKVYKVNFPFKVVVTADDKSLTIERSIIGTAKQGYMAGPKTIPLRNITSVQVRKPTLVSHGILQLGTLGSTEKNYKSVMDATKDDNAIIFSKSHYNDMLELKKFIDSFSANFSEGNTTIINKIEKSPAELIKEYKELLDSGIITQDEFDTKKKSILDL